MKTKLSEEQQEEYRLREQQKFVDQAKESRENWEKMSKMDITLKVNREMGRFWSLWKICREEPWDKNIEDKFATIAFNFFQKNVKRTIVNGDEIKDVLITREPASNPDRTNANFKNAVFKMGLENLLLLPEGNDLRQIEYPYQYKVEPYSWWLTLDKQLERMYNAIKQEEENKQII